MKIQFQGDTQEKLIQEIKAYLQQKGEMPCEVDTVDAATDILRLDYHKDVKDTAESIKAEIDSGEIEDHDALERAIHEACDGTQRVVYTHEAKLALVFSRNADHGLEEGLVELHGSEVPWSQLAYCAFEQDLMEELMSLGVDLNDEHLGMPEWKSGVLDDKTGSYICADCFDDEVHKGSPIAKPEEYTCERCDETYRADGE